MTLFSLVEEGLHQVFEELSLHHVPRQFEEMFGFFAVFYSLQKLQPDHQALYQFFQYFLSQLDVDLAAKNYFNIKKGVNEKT